MMSFDPQKSFCTSRLGGAGQALQAEGGAPLGSTTYQLGDLGKVL